MAQQALSQLGYSVVGMTNSQAALKYIEEHHSEIDVLITDQTMPGMLGTELAEQALNIKSDLLIFLCTGFSNEANAEIAEAIGIKQFIMKPYRIHDLSRMIRDLVDARKKEQMGGTRAEKNRGPITDPLV